MKKLVYSPDAIEKLQEIKRDVTIRYGVEKANAVIKRMMTSFRDLQLFEYKGPSVESMLGIPGDYRYLYVQHNYIFYCVDDATVYITDIFKEKEDFMWQLFGIRTTTQETENYWDE